MERILHTENQISCQPVGPSIRETSQDETIVRSMYFGKYLEHLQCSRRPRYVQDRTHYQDSRIENYAKRFEKQGYKGSCQNHVLPMVTGRQRNLPVCSLALAISAPRTKEKIQSLGRSSRRGVASIAWKLHGSNWRRPE